MRRRITRCEIERSDSNIGHPFGLEYTMIFGICIDFVHEIAVVIPGMTVIVAVFFVWGPRLNFEMIDGPKLGS